MRGVAAGFLILNLGLWLWGRFQDDGNLAAWSFVTAYAGLAMGLLMVQAPPRLEGFLRLFGGGFLALTLGEFAWMLLLVDGASPGNPVWPSVPYYLGTLLFLVATLRLHAQSRSELGTTGRELFPLGLTAAFLTVVLTLGLGLGLPKETAIGFWFDSVDNLGNMFVTLLLTRLNWLARRSAWGDWLLPLSAGSALMVLANLCYTVSADQYQYGALIDWLWVMQTTITYLVLLRPEEEPPRPGF